MNNFLGTRKKALINLSTGNFFAAQKSNDARLL